MPTIVLIRIHHGTSAIEWRRQARACTRTYIELRGAAIGLPETYDNAALTMAKTPSIVNTARHALLAHHERCYGYGHASDHDLGNFASPCVATHRDQYANMLQVGYPCGVLEWPSCGRGSFKVVDTRPAARLRAARLHGTPPLRRVDQRPAHCGPRGPASGRARAEGRATPAA